MAGGPRFLHLSNDKSEPDFPRVTSGSHVPQSWERSPPHRAKTPRHSSPRGQRPPPRVGCSGERWGRGPASFTWERGRGSLKRVYVRGRLSPGQQGRQPAPNPAVCVCGGGLGLVQGLGTVPVYFRPGSVPPGGCILGCEVPFAVPPAFSLSPTAVRGQPHSPAFMSLPHTTVHSPCPCVST